MFQRKGLKKEAGFVTVMPLNNTSIQFSKNGNRLGEIGIEILDLKGNVLLTKKLIKDAEIVDLNSLKRGNYTIKLTHNKQVSNVPFSY